MHEFKTALEILGAVELTTKTNEKLALLKQGKKLNAFESRTLHFLINAALNYEKLYYIKDLPELDSKPDSSNPTWPGGFMLLLDKCEKTGRTKETKEEVMSWLNSQSPLVGKWCRRVILRDLRCGVSVETANKAGFEVPVFEVQLATNGKKSKKLAQIIAAIPMISPKLDGYRCVAIIDHGNVKLFSRNGTEFQNFPTIKEELSKQFSNHTIVFDGEIMSNTFNKMQQSAFANKRGTTVGDVIYNIFDLIEPEEWNSNNFTTPYFKRYFNLVLSLGLARSDLLKLVPHFKISSMNEALNYEREFTEQGYEGAIISPDIPYYRGRSSNKMLKLKTMESEDCKIIGFVEGTGKHEGRLGAFIAEQGNFERCEVGTGLTDEDRDHIWQNRKEFLDQIIECKYQELTDDGIMRFPVFIRFRDDKRNQHE